MTSQHSTHDIKAIISHLTLIISDSTFTVSLSSHPDYRSYNPHCMYEYTATICMTSYELPMTSHPLFMISNHTMTSHPLYSYHHSRDACHGMPCSWTITYSVLIMPHLLYVWYETDCMYHITRILYDITLTLYDITIRYSWHHIHSIHGSTPRLYDITYTIFVWSQPLYLWQDTSYVYGIIFSTYDISHCLPMKILQWYLTWCSQYLCNHTHLIDDITTYVFMKSHQLHIGHHRHYLWHHNLSWWHHNIVCMSWHPLCFDVISTIYDVTQTVCMKTQALYLTWNPFYLKSHLLYTSSQPLCRTHHTNYVRHHRWHMYAIMCTIHDTISTL